MITNHTELLNGLVKKYELKTYLEIGVQNPSNNYSKIKCDTKVGVDPEVNDRDIRAMTSDEYFAAIKDNDPAPVFDLIFIDGFHEKEQVKRDFENSCRYLSDKGFIVIHDVLPENEEGSIVPRITKVWWGDVYKFAMNISQYSGIGYKTFNIDNGCMMVWKDSNRINRSDCTPYRTEYKNYLAQGRISMNVTDEISI